MPKACLRHDGRGIGRRLRLGRFTNPMHPAYSVILFTTASGAGYGLLVWLALCGLLGLVPTERWLGIAGFGLAFALITGGPAVFDRASWPARARVARVLAMAHLVAVARGRDGGGHLCAGGRAGDRMGVA